MYLKSFLTGLVLFCLTMGLAGCRNGAFNGLQPLAGGTRIPAPETYYNTRANQPHPYYNPNATASNQGLVSPSGVAPTSLTPTSAAGGGGNVGGWRPKEGIAQDPTSFNVPAGQIAPARMAQNQLQPGGYSYMRAPNYQSTTVDERRDDTRLPLTDATAVRAPTSFGSPGNLGAVRGVPSGYSYPSTSSPLASAPQYRGSSNVVRGSFRTTGAPTVLAESTVGNRPNGAPNVQAGWRDRVQSTSSGIMR